MIGAWALWAASGQAAPADEAVVDYRGYLDQARFFVKKGWNADAAEQLELAARHPDGRLDPEVWFLLARVRYALADLDGARAAAEQALTMSRDDGQAAATTEWLDFLARSFGTVELVGQRPGLKARITLEPRGTLLDPELKAWVARAEERLAAPVELPLRLGLPAGYAYAIDGTELTLAAGEVHTVAIVADRVVAQTVELPLSLGVGSWIAPATLTADYPAPIGELGVIVPLGPLVAGARGGVVVQAWEDAEGTAIGPFGTASVELGVDGARDRAIGWRLGASGRWSRVPGVLVISGIPAFPSEQITDDAWAPGLWASSAWHDPRSASGVSVGLRLVAERAFGVVRNDEHRWASGPRPYNWAATGVRVVLDVAWTP